MFLDQSWPHVTETLESKAMDKGDLLYPLYDVKNMIVLPPKPENSVMTKNKSFMISF